MELRERTVRMCDLRPEAQIKGLAIELGVDPEALRGWIRQAEAYADADERDDRLTTDERAELAALQCRNAPSKPQSPRPGASCEPTGPLAQRVNHRRPRVCATAPCTPRSGRPIAIPSASESRRSLTGTVPGPADRAAGAR
ncbi:transposase [Streptomyces sp. NPDC090798]|uniref:transposase n=1 Tax=Streptomyces sp. NPDC090798 TaxID=3365968 RepID=UPI003821ADD2